MSSNNSASTPTQAPAAGVSGGVANSGSLQGDLDLFSESSSTTKADDAAKKPLSKDSILSLYGTNSMSQQAPTGKDLHTNWNNTSAIFSLHIEVLVVWLGIQLCYEETFILCRKSRA